MLGVRQKNSHMGRRITHNEVVRIRGLTYTSPGLTAVSPAFAFGYPGTCRVGRLSSLIGFCDVGPTFILSLYVVGYRIGYLLVLGSVFRVSDVKGVAFES